MLFIEWDETRTRKVEHQYLAQIAFQIARGSAKHPEQVKFEKFLFRTMEQQQEQKVYTSASKAAWGAALGMNLN